MIDQIVEELCRKFNFECIKNDVEVILTYPDCLHGLLDFNISHKKLTYATKLSWDEDVEAYYVGSYKIIDIPRKVTKELLEAIYKIQSQIKLMEVNKKKQTIENEFREGP